MSPEAIILSSASPRRHMLLAEAGIAHEVVEPSVDEAMFSHETPRGFVVRIACLKAEAAAARFPARVVLAADTVVCLNGKILGKPGTRENALSMLEELSGKSHEVISGVVMMRRNPFFEKKAAVVSQVTFRLLEKQEIESYIACGEGLDKAGGYGIQGRGGRLVAGYWGSFSNIVGLPMETVRLFLDEAFG